MWYTIKHILVVQSAQPSAGSVFSISSPGEIKICFRWIADFTLLSWQLKSLRIYMVNFGSVMQTFTFLRYENLWFLLTTTCLKYKEKMLAFSINADKFNSGVFQCCCNLYNIIYPQLHMYIYWSNLYHKIIFILRYT